MKTVMARKVVTPEDRESALAVIEAVYLHEKQWIESSGAEIPKMVRLAHCHAVSGTLRDGVEVAADGITTGLREG